MPSSGDPKRDAAWRLLEVAGRVESEDDFLVEVVGLLREMSGAGGCELLLREPGDGLVLKASTSVPDLTGRVRLGRGVGLCGKVLTTAEPIFLEDHAPRDAAYAKCPGLDDQEYRSMAILPLAGRDREAVRGVLLLRRAKAWKMPQRLRDRMIGLAESVDLAYRAFSNTHALGAQSSRLGALSEVSKTISASPYLEEILQLLVHLTAQQFNYRVCTVRLLDERRGELVLRATQAPAKAYQRKRAIKLGESIAGRAIDENCPIIVQDVQVEADYIGHDLAVEQGLRSMICVPLTITDRAVGVLSCYTSEVRAFPPDEIKALETLAKQAAVSIEHAKLQVRSTLMQEMHHRVKNNLQQVASLLRLQMRHGEYRTLEEALSDCLARILSIASVHDLLSREDLDHVGIRSIADTLVQSQQSSFIPSGRTVRFEVRGDDVHLNVTQATQLALVLNELIQNAVEHGFATVEDGEVHVTVEEHDGEVSVWVSNSGTTLPQGFDPGTHSHLGLQIVDSLARALGGRFLIEDRLGWTVAEVRFPRATGE
jgi:two-component system, sensor histidine kinase PdtaS